MKTKLSTAQQSIINRYKKATAYSLDDVYANYSVYKARAERDILDEMRKANGWGYRILGANTCTFSCAYLKANKEDGQIEIVYHTAQNKKVFDYID